MHVELANEVRRIVHLVGLAELEDDSEGLPGVLSLQPFEVIRWILGYSVDYVHHRVRIGCSIIQRKLILAPFIGKMHFEPIETILTEPLSFRESQDSTIDIGAHMVQMW